MGALKIAVRYTKERRYKEAAKLFHDAYRLDPKAEYLFNAARSMDYDVYRSRKDEIDGRFDLGWILTGTGVVVGGAGVFLAATASSGKSVSLLPWRAGRGLTLSARF